MVETVPTRGARLCRHWVGETRRAVLWGAVLPLVALAGLFVTPWALVILAAYPAQVLRLQRNHGWERAFFMTLAKFPEAMGVLQYHFNRLRRRRSGLIEYK
jgi:Flp pilus assembly protein TadB